MIISLMVMLAMLQQPQHGDSNVSEGNRYESGPVKSSPNLCPCTIKKFLCTPGEGAAMFNVGELKHLTLHSNHSHCVLVTTSPVEDVTIDGVRYDWCGPTRDGYTPCYRKVKPQKRRKVQTGGKP